VFLQPGYLSSPGSIFGDCIQFNNCIPFATDAVLAPLRRVSVGLCWKIEYSSWKTRLGSDATKVIHEVTSVIVVMGWFR